MFIVVHIKKREHRNNVLISIFDKLSIIIIFKINNYSKLILRLGLGDENEVKFNKKIGGMDYYNNAKLLKN